MVRLVFLNSSALAKGPKCLPKRLPIRLHFPLLEAGIRSPQLLNTELKTGLAISPPAVARFWNFSRVKSFPRSKYSNPALPHNHRQGHDTKEHENRSNPGSGLQRPRRSDAHDFAWRRRGPH